MQDIPSGTKTRTGEENGHRREFNPRVYANGSNRCPVAFYREYSSHRPTHTADSPFFLQIDRKENLVSLIWYRSTPMGRNKISAILTEARKQYGFAGEKVACHSVRKTGLGRLLDADIPDVFVAQHAGMKTTDSLSSYKAAGPAQIEKISNALSARLPPEVR